MSTYLSTYWTLFDHLVDYNLTLLIRSCPSCEGDRGAFAAAGFTPFMATPARGHWHVGFATFLPISIAHRPFQRTVLPSLTFIDFHGVANV